MIKVVRLSVGSPSPPENLQCPLNVAVRVMVNYIGLENTVLGRPNHSWSDRRWGVIIEQPIGHLLSQMFQQQINSAMRINSHSTDVTMLG